MSFGFSTSDFLAVIELAKKIRKKYIDAPAEFNGALDVLRSLSIVLQDAEEAASTGDLSPKEETDLQDICDGCQNVLSELERTLDKYTELESRQTGIGRRLKRVWKRLSLEPEDIRNLRSRVSVNIDLLNAFTQQRTRDNTISILQYQKNQEQRAISQEQQAILDWLTRVDYSPQQNDFLRQRQVGSGQWLLDSVEFKDWTGGNKRTLLCPGIPGAGKTILTSIVVEELSERFQNNDGIIVVYIYCNFRRQAEQTLEALLASLLKQLAEGRHSLPGSVKSLHDRCKAKKIQPSADDISAGLQSVASEYSQVFIVIDALDECQVQDHCQTLLSNLFDLQTKCGINLFATSRFIPEITEQLKQDLLLEIRASEQDVRRYIGGRVSHLPSFVRRNPDLEEEVKSKIVEAVDGMFLLARLHLDSLIGKKSVKALRAALEKLPVGSNAYDYAYDAAMERIEGQLLDQVDLAKQVLSWITCAKRPLTIEELQHALAVEIGEAELDMNNISPIEDLVTVCAGLVAVDEESHIARLVHYTTQEYFERTQTRWFPTAEADIVLICVTYLSFNVFGSGSCPTDSLFEERLLLNPLYSYIARYWGQHARQVSSLHSKVVEFLQCTTKVEAASQAMRAVEKSWGTGYSQVGRMTGLHLAAYLGITGSVAKMLQFTDVNSKDSVYNRTPLSWAADMGRVAVVELLLNTDKVDIDAKDSDYGRTPLSWAATRGHEAVAKLLLDTGKADVDAKDSRYGRTPLSWAAGAGHKAVAKLLLDTGKVDVDAKDSTYGRTPLSRAAEGGYKAIVKLLLDTGKADVDAKDSVGSQTPLSWAAEGGHEAVAKLLLDTGKADVDAKDEGGRTPLSWATTKGYKAVAKLLLDAAQSQS